MSNQNFDLVHEENGKWYFYDETLADRCGPYSTEEETRQQLSRYIEEELG